MNLNQRLLYGRGLFIFRMLPSFFFAGWWRHCDYFINPANATKWEDFCSGLTYSYVTNPTAPGEYFYAPMCYDSPPKDEVYELMGVINGSKYWAYLYFNIPYATPQPSPTFAPTPTATKIICSCKSKKLEVRVVFSLVSTLQ